MDQIFRVDKHEHFTCYLPCVTRHPVDLLLTSKSPFYLPCKKLIFVRLQIFWHAGCNFFHPEELSPHAKNYECGYWCLQIWSRIPNNWHFMNFSVQILGIESS